MNLLIIGSGKGSFQMRAIQLGAALGARVTSTPTDADWRWAELVILLKRAGELHAPTAHAANVPIVWDALDCWQQPRDNRWSVEDGIRHFEHLMRRIRPVLTITATEAMATDMGGTYLPHQARLGLAPTAARDDVQIVAYDGSERYLGLWRDRLEKACQRRSWTFVVNPPDLASADILVALREGEWDGPLCRRWKSGVKCSNAIAAGRPILSQSCAAFDEMQPDGLLIESMAELDQALETLADGDYRRSVVEHSLARATEFSLETIAAQYRAILNRVEVGCCP